MKNKTSSQLAPKLIDRLAEALCFILKIDSGIQLVAIIGNGNEINNLEAVKTWIVFNSNDFTDDNKDDMLPILSEKLKNSIEDSIYRDDE